MRSSSTWGCRIKKLAALVGAVLALVIVPFLLFGGRIEAFIDSWDYKGMSQGGVAMAVSGLLASDIFLPIPSSIISTLGGRLLGFVDGLAASSAGMTASCLIGYWFGAFAGRPAASRLTGEEQLKRMERFHSKWGLLMVIIARPVPVLAEASVLFAGIARLDFGRYALYSTLSNIGISAIYSAAGSYSSKLDSFLLSFAAAVLLPGLFMLLARVKLCNAQADSASADDRAGS